MTPPELLLEQVMVHVNDIPGLPDVLFKVNEVVNDPESSAEDLERAINNDIAVSAKLMRLVNSASYGLPSQISTLSRAIPMLGFTMVRNLVMSVSLFQLDAIFEPDLKKFWLHSFATGVVAQAIAVTDRLPDAKSQSLAGLLHDIGKVVFIQNFIRETQAVLHEQISKGVTYYEAEKNLFLTNHAEIGKEIAIKWNFPPNLIAAIGYHHDPDAADGFADFARVTATANILCQLTDEGFFFEKGYDKSADACSEYYPLSEKAYKFAILEFNSQTKFFENFIEQLVLEHRAAK